ncbi:hypothetical protein ABZ370_01715 [Streptomyces sp. NPDC005962]|uniref:effector-associated constant component EACC1 n=1 Tax=Streptomyces sp. NPDC005962 TaxID=3154466 RepID=UPI0033CB5BE6
MRFEIHAQGKETRYEVESFYRWMALDFKTSRQCHLTTENRSASTGDMGGAFDTVTAITDQLTALANLTIAYLTWRATRPQNARTAISARIETESASIELSGLSEQQVRTIVNELTQDSTENENGS